MSGYETLIDEVLDGIGYVTINRPEKLNALNRTVMDELDRCFREMSLASTVRAVILTGAGEKAFAAGADINELAAQTPAEGREKAIHGQGVLDRIERLGKPVIAAVNGFALGGGCELALACTLRVAAEKARFGQPEVKLGLIPGYGGTQRLPRLVGPGRALQLILTGEMITAAEAYEMGLVNRVVPQNELMGAAEALARQMMANAPQAVRFAMEAVRQGLEMSQEQGQALEATLFGLCCATADMKEGTRAFLEKRPARFVGK